MKVMRVPIYFWTAISVGHVDIKRVLSSDAYQKQLRKSQIINMSLRFLIRKQWKFLMTFFSTNQSY